MPYYYTRFQARLRAEQAQQVKPSVPHDEIAHIAVLIQEAKKHCGYISKIGVMADLFQYIVDHPTIMNVEKFRIATKNNITELNSDPTVKATKRLLLAIDVLEKM